MNSKRKQRFDSGKSIEPNCNNATSVLDKLFYKFRRKKILRYLLNTLWLSISFFFMLSHLGLALEYQLSLILVVVSLSTYFFLNSSSYRRLNSANLLEHINRFYPEYQESAQLLLKSGTANQNLSALQVLQRDKIGNLLVQDYQNNIFEKFYPKIINQNSIIIIILSLLILFFSENIQKFDTMRTTEVAQEEGNPDSNNGDAELFVAPEYLQIKTIISPPTYTKLEPYTLQSLNIEVPESSEVTWQLEFSNPDISYFFLPSGKQEKILDRQDRLFSISAVIDKTLLYQFGYQLDKRTIAFDSVQSIAMLRDQPPKIKIIQPQETLIEIVDAPSPSFHLQVEVFDDYDISDVKILASVAKGSGEAVKFRDKEFRFEKDYLTESTSIRGRALSKRIYDKHWSLIELEMEPGDEIYFSVQVDDNKQPVHQTSKSSSIIVRWLEESDIEMAAEGIKISFIPEYFRSQRQIIIETEQLISDRNDMSEKTVTEISTELGHAQSDLKQKYGQYLGDEFGEGPGEQFGLADGYHGGESLSVGEASTGVNTEHGAQESTEKTEDENHSSHSEDSSLPTHEHSDQPEINGKNDLSGATELIQQFAHNHGTTEIGPMSQRDPKSWMKMAVNEMWQAELHLMLSDPEKALPYEYKAYKYLKLARQAERVYAKRLGFEPPPVTEDRRLTGELKDILEYDLSYQDVSDNQSDRELFKLAHREIAEILAKRSNRQLSSTQLTTFSRLSNRLLELAQTRPALIHYAAIAEQITITNSINLAGCEQCVERLQNKLWQLLPLPISLPSTDTIKHGLSEKTERDYLDVVRGIRSDYE